MVAPILTGTGVKTKILEAMARAVTVITTSKGVEGLGVEPASTCWSPTIRATSPIM